MTATSSKKGLLERRFSFRRSNDPDASASYHRSSKPTTNQNSKLKRFPLKASIKSSLKSSMVRRLSVSSDISEDLEVEIDSVTQALAIRAAEESKNHFRESLPESLIRAHDARDCLAPFRKDEVILGPKLGSGEFANVYEVQSFQFQPDFVLCTSFGEEELDRRLYMKENEKYRETENACYAVKHIREDYYRNNDPDCYVQAASDLALEVEFLASLQHPNIIKLRGITHLGADGFGEGPSGYFLIMDRLSETLDQRIRKWRIPIRQDRRMPRLRRTFSLNQQETSEPEVDKKKVLDERLSIALQISAAMVYLHKHSIIFRDLKPANIGFDVRGDVKIFDFGLARLMPENGDPNVDLFEMSGAGSPRYMAPECLSGHHYNMKADVYTFSIILWEILSALTPYVFVRKRTQLINFVVEQNGRPDIDESWPDSIRGMLESSFDPEIEKRPTMNMLYDVIREALASLRGHRRGLNNKFISRRRTMESMRNLMQDM